MLSSLYVKFSASLQFGRNMFDSLEAHFQAILLVVCITWVQSMPLWFKNTENVEVFWT